MTASKSRCVAIAIALTLVELSLPAFAQKPRLAIAPVRRDAVLTEQGNAFVGSQIAIRLSALGETYAVTAISATDLPAP